MGTPPPTDFVFPSGFLATGAGNIIGPKLGKRMDVTHLLLWCNLALILASIPRQIKQTWTVIFFKATFQFVTGIMNFCVSKI